MALAPMDWREPPSSGLKQAPHLLHSFRGSSLQSLQSCSWSHTLLMSMHSPLLHLNFPGPKHWLTITPNTGEKSHCWSNQCNQRSSRTRWREPYRFCSWFHQSHQHSLGCRCTACCRGCSYRLHTQTGQVCRFETLWKEVTQWNEASQRVPSQCMEENWKVTYGSWPHHCHPCSQGLHRIAIFCECTRQSHTGSHWRDIWYVSLADGHTVQETRLTGRNNLRHHHTPSWGGCRKRCCTGTHEPRRSVGHSPARHCHHHSRPGHYTQSSWRHSGRWSKWTHQHYMLCCLSEGRCPVESTSTSTFNTRLSSPNQMYWSLMSNFSFWT